MAGPKPIKLHWPITFNNKKIEIPITCVRGFLTKISDPLLSSFYFSNEKKKTHTRSKGSTLLTEIKGKNTTLFEN